MKRFEEMDLQSYYCRIMKICSKLGCDGADLDPYVWKYCYILA
jgi:hypothetical protein